MKAYVDPDLCIGCGLCPSLCEDVFYLTDEGIAEAYKEEIPDELESDVENARDSCPVSAISIE